MKRLFVGAALAATVTADLRLREVDIASVKETTGTCPATMK